MPVGVPFKRGPDARRNPGGRPKAVLHLEEEATANAPEVLHALYTSAVEGNVQAQVAYLAYAMGKPRVSVEVSGENGGPIETHHTVQQEPPSPEHLAQVLQCLASAGALPFVPGVMEALGPVSVPAGSELESDA